MLQFSNCAKPVSLGVTFYHSKNQMSHGFRSGLCPGCGICWIPWYPRKNFVVLAVWAGPPWSSNAQNWGSSHRWHLLLHRSSLDLPQHILTPDPVTANSIWHKVWKNDTILVKPHSQHHFDSSLFTLHLGWLLVPFPIHCMDLLDSGSSTKMHPVQLLLTECSKSPSQHVHRLTCSQNSPHILVVIQEVRNPLCWSLVQSQIPAQSLVNFTDRDVDSLVICLMEDFLSICTAAWKLASLWVTFCGHALSRTSSPSVWMCHTHLCTDCAQKAFLLNVWNRQSRVEITWPVVSQLLGSRNQCHLVHMKSGGLFTPRSHLWDVRFFPSQWS